MLLLLFGFQISAGDTGEGTHQRNKMPACSTVLFCFVFFFFLSVVCSTCGQGKKTVLERKVHPRSWPQMPIIRNVLEGTGGLEAEKTMYGIYASGR